MDSLPEPNKVRVAGNQYRIIATHYPPINFFEKHIPASMMGALWALEAQTNPRLQDETGELELVDIKDRVSGPGATVVMASFTHIGFPSRFTNGTYGVYYAGRSLETAIRETVHHRSIIAQDAKLSASEFSMRVWIGKVRKYLHDIRGPHYNHLHDKNPRPRDHPQAQTFGKMLKSNSAWGVLYRSVRHEGGECIAAFRPPAITLPTQGAHLVYVWNGSIITHVYEKSAAILIFSN